MTRSDADRMRKLAAEAVTGLVADPQTWHATLGAEHVPLVAAVRWFVAAGEAPAAVEMVANLFRYWFDDRYHAVGYELAAAALAMPGASAAPRYLDAVMVWAGLTFVTGRPADAAYDRLLTEARQRGDKVNEVEGLIGLARVAARAGEWVRVREHALAALELAESTGDGAHRRVPAHALAAAARAMGDYPEARRRYTESIEIGMRMGLAWHVPSEQRNLGHVELRCGNLGEAEQLFSTALAAARRAGTTTLLRCGVLDFGILAVAKGQPERGAVLVAAAMAAFTAAEVVLDPDDDEEYQAVRWKLRDTLDPARLAELTDRGSALSLDEALTMAQQDGIADTAARP